MSRPRLLDLFCGGGGAAVGYHRAGFDVVGVDLVDQPRYPFEFHQADAMTFPLDGFDAIHASPPCQGYSSLEALNASRGNPSRKPRLIVEMRARLQATGRPYVIENVMGAPLINHIRLCGSSFGLGVRRHRLFEVRPIPLGVPPCAHHAQRTFVGVYGDHPQTGTIHMDGYVRQPRAASIEEAGLAMGIDWMDWQGLREAIPPSYTQWIGEQLLMALEAAA